MCVFDGDAAEGENGKRWGIRCGLGVFGSWEFAAGLGEFVEAERRIARFSVDGGEDGEVGALGVGHADFFGAVAGDGEDG